MNNLYIILVGLEGIISILFAGPIRAIGSIAGHLPRAVRATIARLLAGDPEMGFTVKTESGATASTLLEVGDAAREAGIKQVNWPAEEDK